MIIKFIRLNLLFVFVYFNQSTSILSFLEEIDTAVQVALLDSPTVNVMYGGDFNGRVGELNQLTDHGIFYNTYCMEDRKSADVVINQREKEIIEFMESRGMILLNGRMYMDYPGSFTFVSTVGKSTIDLCWSSRELLQMIKNFRVLHIATASDHFPLEIILEDSLASSVSHVESLGLVWTSILKDEYQNTLQLSTEVACIFADIDTMNETLSRNMKQFISKKLRKRNNNIRKNPWTDSDCHRLKKKVEECLRSCKINNFSLQDEIKAWHIAKKEYVEYKSAKKKTIF